MGANALPLALLLLTVETVAEVLHLSVRSVRTLIALGELPVVRVGARAIRVLQADLTDFIERRRNAARSKTRSRGPPEAAVGDGRKKKRPHELVSGDENGSSARPIELNGGDRIANKELRP